MIPLATLRASSRWGSLFVPRHGREAPELKPSLGSYISCLQPPFFLMLSYFALRLFTRTNPKLAPTPQKLARNRIYRTCGYVMLVCILMIAVLKLTPGTDTWVRNYKVVFWFEAAAVAAFGVSWLVKGEAILGDKSE